ncbi:MAG: hypothetical protein GPJ54_07915 [Candidatus Heimdallarchaeota archaeon]|nr:hypothetical protein [Candidatus Heimdallarchaeota archaeon]
MNLSKKFQYTMMLIVIVLLLGSALPALSSPNVTQTVKIENVDHEYTNEEIGVNSIVEGDSSISLTTIDPSSTHLAFTNFTNVFIANTTTTYDIDTQLQLFHIDANASSQIEINATLASSNSDLEAVLYWIDVFDQDFNPIAFAESNIFETPNIQRLPFRAEYDGIYYIQIFVAEGIEFDPRISLSVAMYPPGQIQVGERQRAVLNSNGYERIVDIMDYFQDVGFYNEFYDVQLDTLAGDTQNVVRGLSTAIYGLSRSGIFRGASAAELGFLEVEAVAPHFGVANKTLELMDSYRHVNNGIYTTNPLSGNDQAKLSENVYALMAMMEFWNVLDFSNPFRIILETRINDTMNAINDVFYDGTDGYVETSSLNGDGTPNVQGDVVYTESNALLVQLLVAFPFTGILNTFDFNTRAQDTYNNIETNLVTDGSNVNITSLNNIKVPFEYYNKNNADREFDTRLISQIFYMDMQNPVIGHPFLDPFSKVDLDLATKVMENIFKLYSSSNGLLYTKLNISSGLIEETTNTNEISFFLNSLTRVAGNWKNIADPSVQDVSRTIYKRTVGLKGSLDTVMFDEQSNSYFATYDHASGFVSRRDESFSSNSFIANTAILDYLSTEFPVQVIIETQKETIVDSESFAFIFFRKVEAIQSFVWFNPLFQFTVDATIFSTEIGFSQNEVFDLGGFEFDTGFLDFPFTPVKRGTFSLNLDLKQEGVTQLVGNISSTALGIVRPEFSFSDFEIFSDGEDLETTISIIDENGVALSNLEVELSLGIPIDQILENKIMKAKYYTTDRTDVSGNIDIDFDISSVVTDFNLFTAGGTGLSLNQFQKIEAVLPIFLQVSNAEAKNLFFDRPIVLELRIQQAQMRLIVSPSFLEVVQGSDDSYSFTISVINQDNEPVSLVNVAYDINGISNSVTTGTDGSATVTISSLNILSLTFPQETIKFTLSHNSYQTHRIEKVLNIIENRIKINANPVQLEIRGRSFFESDVTKLAIEVNTEDRFSNLITANVSIAFKDPSKVTDLDKALADTGIFQSPHTFQIDPSGLDPGEYDIVINADKTGLSPSVTERTITVTAPTLYESLVTVGLLYGGWLLLRFSGMILGGLLSVTGYNTECPHCGTSTRSSNNACHSCGNLLPKKGRKSATLVTPPVSSEIKPADVGTPPSEYQPTSMDEDKPSKDFD